MVITKALVVLLTLGWFVGLWWVTTYSPTTSPMLLLGTTYIVGVGYAFNVWTKGERDGTLAILLAVLLPIPGWFILLFHFADHRSKN